MKIKTILQKYGILFVVLCTASAQLTACSKKDHGESDVFDDPLGPRTGVEGAGDQEEYHILPTLTERTEWNIEIQFLKQDEKGIWITIYDYDNQGFQYNPLYYVLEKHDGSKWVKLTSMNESNASENHSYVFPSEQKPYIDTNNLNYFSLLPSGTELETGRYRLTKILSGRAFSVEFDYKAD